MAGPRFDSLSLNLLGLAALLGVTTLGGALLLAQEPSTTGAEEQVVEVRIVGNRAVKTENIFPHIRTRAGRAFNLETIEEDVRRLNKTQKFVTVKPFSQRVPGGRVVIFEVLERPLLQYIKYIGNRKIKKKVLVKETNLKEGDALDPFAVEEARRRLADFYHSHGFSKARVSVVEGNKPSDSGAIFVINEGPKQKVLWTTFEGNTIASDARLRTQIQSKPGFLWLFKGEVHQKEIDEDINRLTAYYRSLGFFRARIGRLPVFNKKENWLTLTFVIDEGPRYVVRNVSFIGNTKFSTGDLREGLKLQSNQYFNQAQMTGDVATIQDKYGSVGYIFADVKADPRFLEEPGTLDLVYDVQEGDRWRVGRINVEIAGDDPRTNISTVLNRISLRPGDIVDIRELRASERRLRASGLFLVDPQKGVSPKIVFSPPELEEMDNEVARQPHRRGQKRNGTRSQSPDPVRHTSYRPPGGASYPPQYRRIDLTVRGSWDAEEEGEKAEGGRRKADGGRWTAPGFRPSPRAASRGTSFGTSSESQNESLPGQPRMIVRGQYTPGAGFSVPQLPPRTPSLHNGWVSPGSISVQSSQSSATTGQGVAPGQVTPGDGQPAASPLKSSPPQAPATQPPQSPWPPPQQAATTQPPQSAWSPPQQSTTTQPPQSPWSPPQQAATTQPPQSAWSPPQQSTTTQPPQSAAPATPSPPYGNQFPPGSMPFVSGGGSAPGRLPPIDGTISETSPSWLEAEPIRDIDIFPRVSETETGRLMFGVGINSQAGLVGNIVLDEQNFDIWRFPRSWEDIRNRTAWRGDGQRLRIEAVPGTEVQRYMINFTEPYLFDTPVSLATSGYYFDRRYQYWDEQRVGGRVATGYQFQFNPDLSVTVAFRGLQVNVHDPAVPTPAELAEVVGNSDLYGFRAQLTHDTRDSAFLATEGHLFEMSFEQVVGTYQFPRAEIDLRRYFLLHQRPDGSGRHVLNLNAGVGYTGPDTPIFEHFFIGGFSTVRGFRFRGASPRDLGVTIGGEFQLLASAEYLFPITADDALRGVVFCDTGTAEPTIDHWTDNYRAAVGFGLRITIPAMGPAPIALDFAVPVSRNPGDEILNFSFFVGMFR